CIEQLRELRWIGLEADFVHRYASDQTKIRFHHALAAFHVEWIEDVSVRQDRRKRLDRRETTNDDWPIRSIAQTFEQANSSNRGRRSRKRPSTFNPARTRSSLGPQERRGFRPQPNVECERHGFMRVPGAAKHH